VRVPKYDVAVVGAGLGGLAAAALMSSKKKKTVVIERDGLLSKAVGEFKKDGMVFFTAPPLSYGFEHGGLFHEIANRLGFIQDASVHSPSFQVALPDRRITVYPEQSATLEELNREFPNEVNSFTKFYRDLRKKSLQNAKSNISSYLSNRRLASGFMQQYHFSRELMTFFDIQSLYFYRKPVVEISLSALITMCDTPPLYLQGGFRKLADQLCKIILQQGGEIRYNEPSVGFAVKNKRIVGVTTGQGVVESRTILLNTAVQRLSSSLFIGLREEVVPVGMCQEVLFLPDYQQPRNFIALSLSDHDDTATAPRGMRTLTASFQSPMIGTSGKQAIIDQINILVPFLNEYLVFAEEDQDLDRSVDLPADMSIKTLRSTDKTSSLFRYPKKNIYVLNNAPYAPLQVLAGVQRFVNKMT
jgi:hypothetical protein